MQRAAFLWSAGVLSGRTLARHGQSQFQSHQRRPIQPPQPAERADLSRGQRILPPRNAAA
jgi:hypothetical protein